MNPLLKQLETLETLSKGTKLTRFLANPVAYTTATFFNYLVYPHTKKGRSAVAETFFGAKMNVILPAATDIYLTGGKTHDSETRLAKYLIKHLSEGDACLDIGAHFGYFTLLVSEIVGKTGKVMAFEASTNTFQILKSNVAHRANVSAFNNALSDKLEVVTFYEFPTLYSEYNSMEIGQFEDKKWFSRFPPTKIDIQTTTINDIIDVQGFVPKIIKIDVEGAEYTVVKGASILANMTNVSIVLEYLTNDANNSEYIAASQQLTDYGYQTHIIGDDGNLIKIDDVDAFLKAKKIDSENVVFVR